MGHMTQVNAAQREAEGKGYNYKPVFSALKPYFSSADIAVINLEHTLAGPPFSGYPQFSSPDESMVAIKDAGFDIITTANNHSLDRGKQGLERTISVLDSLHLKHLGTYRDTAERDSNYPLFLTKNGIKLAFLNYTYGTNMLVEQFPNVVNRIDTVKIAEDIKKAKTESPDFIISIMHWGIEYENSENAEQRELAKFLAQNGVHLIVGGHPHVVQPFDKIALPNSNDSVPVIYSVGNFFSNQRDRYTNGGIIFDITVKKSLNDKYGKATVAEIGYLPFWVYRFTKNGNVFRLLPQNNTEYKMSSEDKSVMNLFFEDTQKTLKNLPIKQP
ncbi:capsular polysaccharide biosynthesis protein [Fibrobacterales bacterium]|nr:capsular polysaccharide biosynthesis protein [Fibrobacterales bacterium]